MTVTGDVRALSPQQLAHAERTMLAIVEKHHRALRQNSRSTRVSANGTERGNRRLLARYDQASRDLGFGAVMAVDPSRAGAADVAFVAGRVP